MDATAMTLGLVSFDWTSVLMRVVPAIALLGIARYFYPYGLTAKAWSAVVFILSVCPAIVFWVLGLLPHECWSFSRWMAGRLGLFRLADRLVDWLEKRPSARISEERPRYTDPMIQGDRLAAAKQHWPEHAFPFLYRDVPPDIELPLHEDGKLVGGVDLHWLADRHMTRTAVLLAVRNGMTVLVLTFGLGLLLGIGDLIYHVREAFMSGAGSVVEVWPGDTGQAVPWSWLIVPDLVRWTSAIAMLGLQILVYSTALALFTIGGSIAVSIISLKSWFELQARPYSQITKDADVKWAHRAEVRLLTNYVYSRQLRLSETYLKETPLYKVGVATGTLRVRGDGTAPTPGQTLNLDRDSLFQHTLIFGGTGEGKTTAMIKPLLRQLMMQKHFGFYVCDAKGVLWNDALKIAEQSGRAGDVVVIGTGPGQYSVDPLANLTPNQVAAAIRSVLAQMGGDSGDSFWPEMAALVLRNIWSMARVFEKTDAGKAEIAGGLHPYSLWWAYQVAQSASRQEAVMKAVDEYREALKAEYFALKQTGKASREDRKRFMTAFAIFDDEYMASRGYLCVTWATMTEKTKTGILAHITQLLDGFGGDKELRERFASGTGARSIPISEALNGKIVLNAISTIEGGLPARLVLILIKTSLYREARVREARFKREEPDRKPQDEPCIVVMDEVQEIATADPKSGLSDATFWNVARSTGLAGIFGTQNFSGLKQSLGPIAAENFIQQARSKIFFRSEDPETVDHACWCAGAYERNRVFEDGQRESVDQRLLLDGWHPFIEVDQNQGPKGGTHLFTMISDALLNPAKGLWSAQRQPTYKADRRFIPRKPIFFGEKGADGAQQFSFDLQIAQMEQSAQWRAEDLDRSYRTSGNEVMPALTTADMLHLGRWSAFAHIQRAGAAKQDIIMVEHDFE